LSVSIAVLGSGILGLSFARHAAERGFIVRLAGRNPAQATENLARAQERWKRGSQGSTSDNPWLERIISCVDPREALQDCQVVLEALPEDLELKASLWHDLEDWASPEVLRLTGTSSLFIHSIRQSAGMKNWLVGFHLFVPVHRMRVVEVVSEDLTPMDLRNRVAELGKALDLRVVPVRDQPGFAAARMALAQGLQAMRLLERNVATADDLDALMVHGYGHPVGPLELSDRIGLQLRLAIAEELYRETGEACFAPPAILRNLVQRGHTGQRAGRGFYQWDEEGKRL